MQHFNIGSEIHKFQELKRRLLEIEPDIDEQTLIDTIDGETELSDAICALVRSALDDEALLSAVKERLTNLKERLARIDARVRQKRELAKQIMSDTGLEKIMEPDFTLSLRNSAPTAEIIDENLIPEWLWIPQPSKLDKKSLLDALKAGTVITGAMLSSGKQSLSVRTK